VSLPIPSVSNIIVFFCLRQQATVNIFFCLKDFSCPESEAFWDLKELRSLQIFKEKP